MSNVSNRVIIFSVFRPEFKGFNKANHQDVLNSLKKHGAVEVVGSYEGVQELSIMIPYKSDLILDLVKRAAKSFNQDSILVTSGDRTATLIYNDNSEEVLGQLQAVSEVEALKQLAWTYVPNMDTYFITK